MLLQKVEYELVNVSEQVLEAGRRVRQDMGAGREKSAYASRLCKELELREVPYTRRVWQPEEYAGATLNCGYEIDLIVDGSLIVELRAQPRVRREDEQYLLTLLTLSGHSAGLIMNFGERHFDRGIRRLYFEDNVNKC